MIQIITTDHEYLISLPYSERSRAKRVIGYTWDANQKLWRYLKNEGTNKAIFAEFGPDEIEWSVHDDAGHAVKSVEANISQNEAMSKGLRERTELTKELQHSYNLILDLWNTAEQYGLPQNSELGNLAHFTKAAYEGNYKQADLAAKLATTEAKLSEATRELAEFRRGKGYDGEDQFRQALIQLAWGDSAMPEVVADFAFNSIGAIELQNFLSRILSQKLNKGMERCAFADLIREAEDAGILSNSVARVCQTLRIQRNYFAHEIIDTVDALPRSALCLFSFVLVYRELLQVREQAG